MKKIWIAPVLAASLMTPAGAAFSASAIGQKGDTVNRMQYAPPTTERRWREPLDRRQIPPSRPYTGPPYYGYYGYGPDYGGQPGQAPPRLQSEVWIVPPPGQTVFVYDSQGNLLSIMDRRGTVVLPAGQNVRLLLREGRTTIWNGFVAATPGYLEVRFSRSGTPRIFRAPGPEYGAEAQPLPPAQFQSFLYNLDSYQDDADRLIFVRNALARYLLTTSQVGEVLRRFVDEQSRLAALVTLEDRIVDQENAADLVDFFWTHQARRRAAAILEAPLP